MKFHENRLLADDSHVISYLIFAENWERCRKICRLLSALMVNIFNILLFQIFLVTDLIFAYLRREYELRHGMKQILENGKEAQVILD